MQKILVIKLGALGDFILLTGVMRSIRETYPKAHITLLTGKAYLPLAEKSKYFDTIEIDNRTRNPKDWYRVCKKILANQKWDFIFDLQSSDRTKKKYYSLARWITKNPINWVSLTSKGLKIKSSPEKKAFTWGKTTFSDLDLNTYPPSLSFCYKTYPHIEKLPEKYILLIPGCSATHPYKRWPAEFYGKVAKELSKKKIYSIVIGTNAEKKEIETVCQKTPFAINFCNKNKLIEIPDLAQHALAVVGNDTGPMHMAELTDTPCFTLFCKKTEKSALNHPNVINFIEQNIEDILPEKVLEKLFSVLK